jgi:hypothetical protein
MKNMDETLKQAKNNFEKELQTLENTHKEK